MAIVQQEGFSRHVAALDRTQNQVEIAVAIHIDEPARGVDNRAATDRRSETAGRGREVPGAVVEIQARSCASLAEEIREVEVRVAVRVDISRTNVVRESLGLRKARRRFVHEFARGSADEDSALSSRERRVIGAGVRDGEVRKAIAVEIGHREITRKIDLRGGGVEDALGRIDEISRAIVSEGLQMSAAGVGVPCDDDVATAVVVEIDRGHVRLNRRTTGGRCRHDLDLKLS